MVIKNVLEKEAE